MITYGSLFSGIGGIDLGFDRCGMTCKWQVEINEFCKKVLAKHWPEVRRHDDIRSFPPDTNCKGEPIISSSAEAREGDPRLAGWRVDCITAGFPCQDISYAGTGAGIRGERSGLFFEAIRVIRELEPRVVVLENVAALLTRGLDDVLGTLASIGFDAEWHCVPAASVGAPHIRDRVFILAYAHSERIRSFCGTFGGQGWESSDTGEPEAVRQGDGEAEAYRTAASGSHDVAYPDCGGQPEQIVARDTDRQSEDVSDTNSSVRRQGSPQQPEGEVLDSGGEEVSNTISKGSSLRQGENPRRPREIKRPIPRGNEWWAVEPEVGRVVDGFSGRVDRVRALGNAVVPQVAEYIGTMVMEYLNEPSQATRSNAGAHDPDEQDATQAASALDTKSEIS